MLKLNKVSKSYESKKILSNLSYNFNKTGIHIIAGPNGIGKSTLLRLIGGAESPDSGDIEISSHYLSKNPITYRQQIVWTPEHRNMFPFLTPLQIFKFLSSLREMESQSLQEEIIDLFNLSPFLETSFSHLSLGNRQKTLLASSFLSKSSVLLFDEPLNGLDPESRQSFHHLIHTQKEQKIIIIVNHDQKILQIDAQLLKMEQNQETQLVVHG